MPNRGGRDLTLENICLPNSQTPDVIFCNIAFKVIVKKLVYLLACGADGTELAEN